MKKAKDFRQIARESLTRKWFLAVAVGLVAFLLGGMTNAEPQFTIHLDASNTDMRFGFAGQTIFSTGTNGQYSDLGAWIIGSLGYIMIAAVVLAVIYFVLGSFVSVGYAKFNLDLTDKQATAFETLFAYFSYWKTTAVMRFFRALYVFLWSLLFIIPGIVAGYSYAMTDYILAENPEITASAALKQSKSMMRGNRFRLFCLQFSFIGWDILATLAFGIGYLWLNPYKQAAYATFYREVSATGFSSNENEFTID